MKLVSLSFLACALIMGATPAEAGVEACGDIYIEAGAECEVVPPGASCQTQCTPISVQAACAAELQVDCSGQCDATASVECTGSCSADCEAECEVDPGSFDCRASCSASCAGDCSASCSASEDQAQCEASCEATCSGSCDAQCEGVPPSATCEGKCEASCNGSCDAEANLDCQIDCQAGGYLDCVADVQGGCQTTCMAEEGALFCDGQYVDYGGSLDDCVAALQDLFDIEVEGYADASCEGDSCTAEAGGSVGCAVGGRGAAGFGVLLIGALALAGGRRRRE